MKVIIIALLCFGVISPALVYGEGGEYDWLKDHIVVQTVEKVKCDVNGEVQTVETVKRSSLLLTQTMSEKKQRQKDGALVTVSRTRTTETTDTDGFKEVVVENEIVNGMGLEISSVVKTEKTATGSITTVQSRSKNGGLVIVKRITVSKDEDGVTTTTVETIDKDGQLVVTEATSTY